MNQLSFDDIGGALIGIINRMNRALDRYLSLSLILTGSCVHPFVVQNNENTDAVRWDQIGLTNTHLIPCHSYVCVWKKARFDEHVFTIFLEISSLK